MIQLPLRRIISIGNSRQAESIVQGATYQEEGLSSMFEFLCTHDCDLVFKGTVDDFPGIGGRGFEFR